MVLSTLNDVKLPYLRSTVTKIRRMNTVKQPARCVAGRLFCAIVPLDKRSDRRVGIVRRDRCAIGDRRGRRRHRRIERVGRSEEHTSELQSLMRISYAVFCLKNKKKN